MSKNRTTITLVVAAALAAVLVVAATSERDRGHETNSAEVAGSASPQRTLLVTDRRMPPPSPPGGRLHAFFVSGRMPGGPSAATVLTDEDCAPDRRGVSRCLNRLQLASGRTLAIRHPHSMMEVPCLSPGERVSVRPA